MTTKFGKHAIVIGAGMGGLAAAGALSERFDRVSVLDRDDLPVGPAARLGAPQGQHVHVLLAGGLLALCELFPRLDRDIELAGAVRIDGGQDVRMELPGFDPLPQRRTGLAVRCLSRPLLEHVTRQSLLRLGNVTLSPRSRAIELTLSPDGGSVVGVKYENFLGFVENANADLVIDASSRGALTLELLGALSMPRPEETAIGIDIAYATGVFEIPDDAPTDWRAIMHLPHPSLVRGGILFPSEGRRWHATLNGYHGQAAPGDREGYLAFAKSLRTPTFHEAVKNAKLIGEIRQFAMPQSVRRHFERLTQFPRGLMPVADAICRFNPSFGQGMSVAAQQGLLLKRLLAGREGAPDPLAGLALEFFAGVPEILAAPWSVAESDFAYEHTRGTAPDDLAQRLRLRRALLSLASEDLEVRRLVDSVNHLISPPSVLREPELSARVAERMAALA